MDQSLLDTDILSEIIRGRNYNIMKNAGNYRLQWQQFTTSVITVYEVVRGFHRIQQEQRIQELFTWLNSNTVVKLDQEAAEIAGRIHSDLERTGQTIGRADPMIAAIAITQQLVLVTGNTAHYQRVQSLGYPLIIANWRL